MTRFNLNADFKNKGLLIKLLNDVNEKKYSWVFEKYDNQEKYIQMERFELNKKFYYKNINTNQIITNFYMGWGNENILY